MDDFGTGYSSLSYLQSFPFDKIKIDQTFIANLDHNPQSAAIIRAVIGLGRGLELPVVAEGVETKSQLDFLSARSLRSGARLCGGPPAADRRLCRPGRSPAGRAEAAARAGEIAFPQVCAGPLTAPAPRFMVRPVKADTIPNLNVEVGEARFGNNLPLALIAGPCVLESRAHALEMASALKEIAARLKIGLVYKTSFDKANRTSRDSARGMGLEQALPIFAEIREKLQLPVLTDVHEAAQCAEAAEAVDVLQIPAFLCRQTDLLVAAAQTGRVINVKKGQFLAPWDMKNVVAKITAEGNRNVLVTERGASFGYNTLVSDMRALPILARTTGAPVIFDATHSVQQPGGQGSSSGGEREFVPVLARAAVAVGVAGVFIETHQDPDHAPSDGPNMLPLKDLEALLRKLMEFNSARQTLTALLPVLSRTGKTPIYAVTAWGAANFAAEIKPIEPVWVMPA